MNTHTPTAPPPAALAKSHALGLTAYETLLFARLLASAGRVVSRDDLTAAVYAGTAIAPESNVLQVLIGRIRKKLADAGSAAVIETVRGRGYRFLHDAEGATREAQAL